MMQEELPAARRGSGSPNAHARRGQFGRLWWGLGLAPLLLAALSLGTAPVRAGSAPIGVTAAPVVVSGPSPFVAGCEGRPLGVRIYRSSAAEPALAADPSNPRHLIAAWIQDKLARPAGLGVLMAFSTDGGQTWTASAPRFSRCANGDAVHGGNYARAADPWLTIAPNGDIYAMALALNPIADSEPFTAILVSRSSDGGVTWSDPTAVSRQPDEESDNEKGTITADPADASTVYAVWSRELEPDATASGLAESPAYFSRTTDGGRTWEAPRVIYGGAGVVTIGHTIVVLPDGTLVDAFTRGRPLGQRGLVYDLALIRSTDRGLTWLEPEPISDVVTAPLRDPYSSFLLQPNADLATIASISGDARTGRLQVVWQDARFSQGDHIDIAYTTSSDGGYTWTAPIQINQTTGKEPAFVPVGAFSADGTAGVTYYDLRRAGSLLPGIATDFWLALCRLDCGSKANWSEAHVAGSFDLERAPYSAGFFLGDFTSIIGTSSGFSLLYTSTNPAGSPAISDIRFQSVTLP